MLTFTTVFIGLLAFLGGSGILVLYAAYLHGKPIVEQKNAREAAKLAVDLLRAARLKRDLEVVENRARLVANQSVMVELRIEEKRKELGLDHGSDSPAW